jgi:transposase InsO family protein
MARPARSADVEGTPCHHCCCYRGTVSGRGSPGLWGLPGLGVPAGGRYRAEGEAAFEPRSRRPKTSPGAISGQAAGLIVRLRKDLAGQGLDAGPQTIAWHLEHQHRIRVSPATISRYLARAGLVVPEPRKRPKSSYIRFQAEQPNECWQSDFTHYPLAGGTDAEILSWLDDHSRFALSVTAWNRVTGPIVLAAFRAAAREHGPPGLDADRHSGWCSPPACLAAKAAATASSTNCAARGSSRRTAARTTRRPQGKAERFQQTLKNWLAAQAPQPATLTQLQALLDTFTTVYNHQRPHRSLPHRATPATAYQARPKAVPRTRDTDTHNRVRTDRLDTNGCVTLRHGGKLYHIGIGRTHARTHVLLLAQDLHIRVINATTGELLRELTLDPTRNYQPTGRPPGPPPGTPRPPRKLKNPEP